MSAYRTAPPGASSLTVALLCASCGVRSEHRCSVETFRCAACGVEQAVLRDDELPKTMPMQVVRAHAAGYSTLVPFSSSIGYEDSPLALAICCAGAEVELSLGINSGVVQHLHLFAPAEGLPRMVLRREALADVRAKEKHVAREVQTGDPSFDREVFIESDEADADVLAPLASPTVRAAVRTVLALCERMAFSDEGVRAVAPAEPRSFEPARLAEQVVALRVIAGAARSASPGGKRARKAIMPYVLAGLGAPTFALVIVASDLYPPAFAAPVLVGLAAGAAAAVASWPLLTRLLRGRSTSPEAITFARYASLATGPLAGVALLLFANGALDHSDEHRHVLAGIEVQRDDDDNGVARVTVRGAEPSIGEHSYRFADPNHSLVLPATVTVTWRDGALGFPWESRPATCHTPDGERR